MVAAAAIVAAAAAAVEPTLKTCSVALRMFNHLAWRNTANVAVRSECSATLQIMERTHRNVLVLAKI